MMKKNNSYVIVLALIALLLAGFIFLFLMDNSEENGMLEGYIINSETGEPVSGVEVSATDSAGIVLDNRENTDATRLDGSFCLELPPGDYTLNLNAAGYLPLSTSDTYTVVSEETTEIKDELALDAADTAGSPANQAALDQTAESHSEPATVITTQEPAPVTTTKEPAPVTTTKEPAPVTTTKEPIASTAGGEQTTVNATKEAVPPAVSADSGTVEIYGNNLNPYSYLSYYSDFDDFFFSYPPSLYNYASSDYSSRETLLGTNVETHTLSGSNGSSLTFSLSRRTDTLNLPAIKDRLYAYEASEIVKKQKKLLDEYEKSKGFSRFVVTGYSGSGNIIYKLVKVTSRYVMEMRIECTPYTGENDEMEKRYVQECIYRYCGFANEEPGNPRTYSEFLKSDKK